MKDYRKVIIGPIITEKSSFQKEAIGTYVFEVNADANKREIKAAVEKMFSVKVIDVRTINSDGKVKRTKWIRGKRKNTKKAYVKIKEDQRIEIFEGA